MKSAEFGNATLRSHQKDQHLSLQFSFQFHFVFKELPLGAATSLSSL